MAQFIELNSVNGYGIFQCGYSTTTLGRSSMPYIFPLGQQVPPAPQIICNIKQPFGTLQTNPGSPVRHQGHEIAQACNEIKQFDPRRPVHPLL